MRLMKPVALALLIVLLPTAVFAQSPAQPQQSGKKMKWIALGSVIAGASLGAVAAFGGSGKAERTSSLTPLTTSVGGVASSNCTQSPAGGGATVVACITQIPTGVQGGVTPPAPPSNPLALPGNISGMSGVPTTIATLQMQQQHKTNWKLIAPAIGAASAGGFLLYRYHVRGKNADVSLRPDGAVQFAVRW